MSERELDAVEPDEALEMYLDDRQNELSKHTLYSHSSRLGHFVQWCVEKNIETLSDVTGRDLHEYRIWRRNDGDLSPVSEKTQMDTLRVFIRWCENLGFAEQDLHTAVISPSLDAEENVRDVLLDGERATAILGYLGTYQYASLAHVLLTLLWRGGMRIGAAHGLDVDDYDSNEHSLHIRHRPETETPLKNKQQGERYIALADETCEVLDDWLTDQRPDVTDEYGRMPLLATQQGRAHKTYLRQLVYAWSRPCAYSNGCPHGRNLSECRATEYDYASECPSSVSPHAIRRGALTYWLQHDWPSRAVADRANVGEDVLEQHYDRRTEQEKMEQRREFLDNL